MAKLKSCRNLLEMCNAKIDHLIYVDHAKVNVQATGSPVIIVYGSKNSSKVQGQGESRSNLEFRIRIRYSLADRKLTPPLPPPTPTPPRPHPSLQSS